MIARGAEGISISVVVVAVVAAVVVVAVSRCLSLEKPSKQQTTTQYCEFGSHIAFRQKLLNSAPHTLLTHDSPRDPQI